MGAFNFVSKMENCKRASTVSVSFDAQVLNIFYRWKYSVRWVSAVCTALNKAVEATSIDFVKVFLDERIKPTAVNFIEISFYKTVESGTVDFVEISLLRSEAHATGIKQETSH